MRDFLYMGPVPAYEDCVQVTKKGGYWEAMLKEVTAYKHQLERMFPDVTFRIKRFEHEFGPYLEVVAMYDTDDKESMNKALEAESKSPIKWDEEALIELGREVAK